MAGLDNMTRDDLKALIKEAMQEELGACGFLAVTPEQRVEMQEDFAHLRKWRRLMDGMVYKVGTVTVTIVIGVIASLIFAALHIKMGGIKIGE
jgi:hypothetical protein